MIRKTLVCLVVIGGTLALPASAAMQHDGGLQIVLGGGITVMPIDQTFTDPWQGLRKQLTDDRSNLPAPMKSYMTKLDMITSDVGRKPVIPGTREGDGEIIRTVEMDFIGRDYLGPVDYHVIAGNYPLVIVPAEHKREGGSNPT
jgi:hypothetical protein